MESSVLSAPDLGAGGVRSGDDALAGGAAGGVGGGEVWLLAGQRLRRLLLCRLLAELPIPTRGMVALTVVHDALEAR